MNLTVYRGEETVFENDGNWLHPLFALQDFLDSADYDPAELNLKDKLIGRGAAVLIYRMGIKNCHGLTVSSRGLSFFDKKSITCTYDKLVDKLDCQTEIVLTDDMSTEDAYNELSRRAGRL